MKKYCMWKDAEVKCLFDFVQEYNKSNKPLSQAFKDYAQKSGRKPNSVRNYYYLELSNLIENASRAKKLDISLAWHSKKQAKFFSEEETNQAMKKIDELGKCGYSVRKACLTIANGNIEEMVRLQNKYRAMTKKSQPKQSNVLTMPKRTNKLSDNEINSLFLGLVRLVKNQAKQEANLIMRDDKEKANNMLRSAILELANKDRQIANLKTQFELLKSENVNQNKTIQELRIQNAKFMPTSKNNKLKKWTEKNIKTKKQNKNIQ